MPRRLPTPAVVRSWRRTAIAEASFSGRKPLSPGAAAYFRVLLAASIKQHGDSDA